MKKFLVLSLFLLLPLSANAVPESFAPLAEKLTPAVVNISTTQHPKNKDKEQPPAKSPLDNLPPGHPLEEFKDFFDKFYNFEGQNDFSDRNLTSLGSGFIISPEGYLVTNNHVVAEAEEITVTMHNDEKYKAEVIGKDSKTDLALLKINADKKLPYVEFGDSDGSKVGDWVLAIGNPFGLGGSVTAGIISARARDINSGPFDDFIQTDAAINRGNSGGPMFNTNGEVIGINTAIYSPSGGSVGIGFAVPSNLAKPIIDQLKKDGKIQRAWLGVKIQNVSDEIAESIGLKKAKGALVVDVTPKSPAGKAGVQPGDVIVAFDGKEVTNMKRLPRMVAETKIGKTVDLEIWREGKTIDAKVTLAELQETEEKKQELAEAEKPEVSEGREFLGLRLTELDEGQKQKYGITENVTGLIITEVKRGSEASKNGIRRGDIVLQANQKKLKTTSEFEVVIKDAEKKGRKSVLLQLSRKGDTIFMALPIE